jgi:hypothetical protein
MNAVSYSLLDRMPAHKLRLNRRACASVRWAVRMKTGHPRTFLSLRVGDIVRLTRHEVAVVPGCGRKTLSHIEERLAELGLSFAEEQQ